MVSMQNTTLNVIPHNLVHKKMIITALKQRLKISAQNTTLNAISHNLVHKKMINHRIRTEILL